MRMTLVKLYNSEGNFLRSLPAPSQKLFGDIPKPELIIYKGRYFHNLHSELSERNYSQYVEISSEYVFESPKKL